MTQATEQQEAVVIRLLGSDYVSSDHTVQREGVDEIEVSNGQKVVWENTQDQVCTINFKKGCAFGHGHKICNFTIEPNAKRDSDVVSAGAKAVFEFSVQYPKATGHDVRGTPILIVSPRSAR